MDFFNLKYDFESSSIKLNEDTFYFYAHPDEFLYEHLDKTLMVFKELINEDVLFKFYNKFYKNNIINLSFEDFKNILFCSVIYHDLGKISFNFQINRLNKKNYEILDIQKNILKKYDFIENMDLLTPNHSLPSSLLFLSKFKDLGSNLFLLILSYVINGHHTGINDMFSQKGFVYQDNNKEAFETFNLLSLYLDLFNRENLMNEYDFKIIQDSTIDFFKANINKFGSFISFFYMYIYSLLIVSDIFATDKYALNLDDFKTRLNTFNFNNRISANLKKSMNESFFSKSYNTNLDLSNYEPLNISDVVDINDLRREMLLESSNKLIQSYQNSRVFFLNMPTGAGKTNTSMKLALDLINNTVADRIIYGMPFINIIEQNYDVIKESFGLSEEKSEIRKIYSGSESIFNISNEFKSDILLNDDFFNYPVICTTFVSLFNTVIKNNKKSKYKLSSLANSVIILDEIQSLPLENWTSLYYIINELAENYNIYFIIMSATLPEFNKLELDYRSDLKYSNISLINNPSKYFDHKLFNRTQIKNEIKSFSLVNVQDDEDYLSTLIKDNSSIINYLLCLIEENFNQEYNKGLMVFNTIKSSKIIYDCLSYYAKDYGFEIDLLNSSLMPSTKKEIISKVNNMKKDEFVDKKYILISTQSVEAGVDVSFDFVVRDFAIIDSIEQVRGRCNRSGELNKRFNDLDKKGNVYLIKLVDANNEDKYYFEYIYDEEEQKTRIFCTENLVNNSLIYSYSDIESYYNNISDIINGINNDKEENFVFNDWENISRLNKAEYSKLKEASGIHIIKNDQEQCSIFICNDLNVMSSYLEDKFNQLYDKSIFNISDSDLKEFYEDNKDDFIFSINEIQFIKDKSEKLYENNKILAKPLLNYYISLFKKNQEDFNYIKIIKKEFASILYKFIINVTINKKGDIYDAINSLDQYGFFYILPEEKIGEDEYSLYSLKRGFNYNPSVCNIM